MSVLNNNNKISIAWEEVQWHLVRRRVTQYQERIYKATKEGNLKKVWYLQRKLICSRDGKLLAILRVTTNKGKNTAGVDRIKSINNKVKISILNSLYINNEAKPIRRVWIPKPGKTEKRPLGIPTIFDRAKQALVLLALEPQWEARFEPNSYGFRPGRSAHDAIEAIFQNLRQKTPKLIFEADLKKCFDNIDHNKLLNKLDTIPIIKDQIKAWLKAGIMEGYANEEKQDIIYPNTGTPQGGIISPLLANIALHGLEEALNNYVGNTLKIKPRKTANNGYIARVKALSIIRYADDFVIIHENKEIFNSCINFTRIWIKENTGLSFNEEKCKITHSQDGFKFLGFHIILVRKNEVYKIKITPHKSNQAKLLDKVSLILTKGRSASSYHIIETLRPIIIGWANYFCYCECKDVFNKLTHLIFLKLRAWVFRRDTRNGRMKIRKKYFPINRTYTYQDVKHKDNWIMVGKQKVNGITRENNLIHIVWVKSRKFVKVIKTKSPYDGDTIYWTLRNAKYGTSTREATLLRKQKGICPECKSKFLIGDIWEVDHIIPRNKGGRDEYLNLQLLHRECHIQKSKRDNLINPHKSLNVQELDEAKVSRPDLKTRELGD